MSSPEWQTQDVSYSEARIKGKTVLVGYRQGSSPWVERVISTDPFDYLDERWQPGTVVAAHGLF